MTETNAPDALGAEDTEKFFGLSTRWLDVPGGRVHYHDVGEGTAVVFLHGSAVGVSAAVNWWRTMPAVSTYARAVAPDLFGYGWTRHDDGTALGLRRWVDQVVAVLDALAIDGAVLVGNSLGGRIALQVAIDHPDRVLGLVTMGTPGPGHRRTEVVKRHVNPSFSPEGIRRVMLDMVADPAVVTDELVDFRYRLAALPGGAERWIEAVQARDETAADRVSADALATITVPTMLVHGREDRVVTPDNAVALSEAIGHADLALLSHCGHWAQIERHELFPALVRSVVERTAE
jgi:2-hydroxymuconate-semialdehyde hydrolase